MISGRLVFKINPFPVSIEHTKKEVVGPSRKKGCVLPFPVPSYLISSLDGPTKMKKPFSTNFLNGEANF